MYSYAQLAGYLDAPPQQFKRGDRVRIKEGYDGAGTFGFYQSKSRYKENVVRINKPAHDSQGELLNCIDYSLEPWEFLADAIEPYPYTKSEKIERAIEDYIDITGAFGEADHCAECEEQRALLFAILDAGV